jgi:hypothetical protein
MLGLLSTMGYGMTQSWAACERSRGKLGWDGREGFGPWLSHPVFKLKPNAHSVCAQESSLHTYRTENGDRITNVSI